VKSVLGRIADGQFPLEDLERLLVLALLSPLEGQSFVSFFLLRSVFPSTAEIFLFSFSPR
jgi:hypothetical protein